MVDELDAGSAVMVPSLHGDNDDGAFHFDSPYDSLYVDSLIHSTSNPPPLPSVKEEEELLLLHKELLVTLHQAILNDEKRYNDDGNEGSDERVDGTRECVGEKADATASAGETHRDDPTVHARSRDAPEQRGDGMDGVGDDDGILGVDAEPISSPASPISSIPSGPLEPAAIDVHLSRYLKRLSHHEGRFNVPKSYRVKDSNFTPLERAIERERDSAVQMLEGRLERMRVDIERTKDQLASIDERW